MTKVELDEGTTFSKALLDANPHLRKLVNQPQLTRPVRQRKQPDLKIAGFKIRRELIDQLDEGAKHTMVGLMLLLVLWPCICGFILNCGFWLTR